MKRTLTIAAALVFASGTAFAFHCPKDMKEIDDALAKHPKLSAAQMKEVKEERAKGEELHKKGDHKGSLEHLANAKQILGLK
jgi:hypothetical protein